MPTSTSITFPPTGEKNTPFPCILKPSESVDICASDPLIPIVALTVSNLNFSGAILPIASVTKARVPSSKVASNFAFLFFTEK